MPIPKKKTPILNRSNEAKAIYDLVEEVNNSNRWKRKQEKKRQWDNKQKGLRLKRQGEERAKPVTRCLSPHHEHVIVWTTPLDDAPYFERHTGKLNDHETVLSLIELDQESEISQISGLEAYCLGRGFEPQLCYRYVR